MYVVNYLANIPFRMEHNVRNPITNIILSIPIAIDDGYGHGVQESNIDYDQDGDYDPYQQRVDRYNRLFGNVEMSRTQSFDVTRPDDYTSMADPGYSHQYAWLVGGGFTDESLPNATGGYYYR